jgi:hypothetical protein
VDDAALWWRSLADGPLLLALFDADDRLRLANAAYRSAWGLNEADTPAWADMVTAATAAGLGPAWGQAELTRAQAQRSRLPQHRYEQAWRDGRRIWWVEQRGADGGLSCTGLDLSGVALGRPLATGTLLGAQAGRELLQTLLADPRAWPLCVAIAPAGTDADLLLARIRSEDGCARLDDGRLLLMLPATGPAQASALVVRLGALQLTEAEWGESASTLLARASA